VPAKPNYPHLLSPKRLAVIRAFLVANHKQRVSLKSIPRFGVGIQGKIARRLIEDGKHFIAGSVANARQGIRLGRVERKLFGQDDWERHRGRPGTPRVVLS